MPSSAVVTGAAGFAGGHLVDLLARSGVDLTAWNRPGGSEPRVVDGVSWDGVDLMDRAAVEQALERAAPDIVYHCAGAPHVGGSWRNITATFEANVRCTHHFLEGLRAVRPDARLVITSSALVYAASLEALTEESVVQPVSPYAVSKLAQEILALEDSKGRHVSIARAFNHIGPRQHLGFVTADFARRIAEIEMGGVEPAMGVGNLDAKRDLTDVRDTVRAYRLIGERGRPGRTYNVCSGRTVLIRDLLDMMLARARVPISVRTDPALFRPIDHPVVVGDNTRIRQELGWAPEIPLEQTVDDVMEYWRRRVAAQRRGEREP
jgi:GDP-4-dehydro-6-deoxy-D-mannose reductase